MITKYNTYIKESNNDDFINLRNDVYNKVSLEIIQFCEERFGEITTLIDEDILSSNYTKYLTLFYKNKILYNIIFSFDKDCSRTIINISNRALDFEYERVYYFIESKSTINKFINKIITDTIYDFKFYYKDILEYFYSYYDHIVLNNNDYSISITVLNSLVFTKELQDNYDKMILLYIENNPDNITYLDLSLCSESTIKKLEHLINASNFDLI